MTTFTHQTSPIKAAIIVIALLISALSANAQTIVINTIPKIGENGVAEGKVVWSGLNAGNAGQYAVIAMLRSSWGDDYVKPAYNNYLNAINASGNFSINITTDSNDKNVEDVSFFLVLRETFKNIDGDFVKYGTMSGKYLGQSITINRVDFWKNYTPPTPPAPSASPTPPTADIMPGFVEAGKMIKLLCEAGNTIRYTVDGSDPITSPTAKTYTSITSLKVPADGSLLVKAVASGSGLYSSVASLVWLPSEPITTPFWGLCVSLALNGENFGISISEETTRKRIEPVAKLTKWVRTFGTLSNGLPFINKIAKTDYNMRTLIGVYITNDYSNNMDQIQGLRTILETGPAPDLIAVGNECSLSGVSPSILASCIDAVREVIKSKSLVIPVGSVDIAGAQWSSSVLDKLDFIGVNIYNGTWDATPESQMFAAMTQSYANEITKHKPKMTLLTETGTPYNGGSYTVNGTTLTPSTVKADNYLDNFLQWVHRENLPSFYFEAYDEATKSQNGGHAIEQYFGIMNGNLQIHSFYQSTINEYTNNPPILSLEKTKMYPYPNPVKDFLILNDLPAGAKTVEIYDISGKVLKTQQVTSQNEAVKIDISNLSDGFYLVKAGSSVCKIIKRQ